MLHLRDQIHVYTPAIAPSQEITNKTTNKHAIIPTKYYRRTVFARGEVAVIIFPPKPGNVPLHARPSSCLTATSTFRYTCRPQHLPLATLIPAAQHRLLPSAPLPHTCHARCSPRSCSSPFVSRTRHPPPALRVHLIPSSLFFVPLKLLPMLAENCDCIFFRPDLLNTEHLQTLHNTTLLYQHLFVLVSL